MNIEIIRFDFDDVNAGKFWDHGLTVDQVEQVLHDRFTVRRNRKNRRAPYIVIGRDFSGQCLQSQLNLLSMSQVPGDPSPHGIASQPRRRCYYDGDNR